MIVSWSLEEKGHSKDRVPLLPTPGLKDVKTVYTSRTPSQDSSCTHCLVEDDWPVIRRMEWVMTHISQLHAGCTPTCRGAFFAKEV